LNVPSAPQVHSLSQVQHLRTAIDGRLHKASHVLDLVAALHPTPAVGGVPTAAAVAYIDRFEPWRGWYASPVGWFDAPGDGDLVVALRSCKLRRRHPDEAGSVTLFAGAGIVAESQSEAEYAEVQLKMDAALEALNS
jgi:isochorismate synthase EntC